MKKTIDMYTIHDVIRRSYTNWIDTEIPEEEKMGECTMWSRTMKAVFPELIHVSGYAYGKMWMESNPRSHYHEYLIDPTDGDIIDPTSKQFDMLFGKDEWEYVRCEESLVR